MFVQLIRIAALVKALPVGGTLRFCCYLLYLYLVTYIGKLNFNYAYYFFK